MIEAIQTYYGQDKNTCAHCGGSDSAKQAVTKAHEEINQQYDSLMNSPYLSQEVKDSLKTLHENTEYCWDALEQGKTCDDSTANTNENGPNATIVFAAANYSCYTQKADAETKAIERWKNDATENSNKTYTVTIDQMKAIFPNTKSSRLESITDILNLYMSDMGINSSLRLSYLLSQIGAETDGFRVLDEKDDGKYTANNIQEAFTKSQLKRCNDIDTYVKDPNNPEKLFNCIYCCTDGNGDESSGDGYTYRGRGLIQLTHKDSYSRFTEWYNDWYKKKYPDDYHYQNFVTTPDSVSLPKYATLSALWEFCVDKNYDNRIFKLCDKDELSDKSQMGSIGWISKWINGKYPPNGYTERKKILKNSKNNLNKN